MAAYSDYQVLENDLLIANAPNTYITVKYKYKREGAAMYYIVYVYARLKSAESYRNDSHGLTIKLDDVEKYTNTTWKASGSGHWPVTFENTVTSGTSDFIVSNKTSGTTKLYIRFWDSQGSASFDWSKTYDLTVSPAMSTLASVTSGTTLSGPTVTVNKSNSGFTDNLYIFYGNDAYPTFSRSNFTSGKITFSESERRTIYNKQDVEGTGVGATWKVKGETYSGSTKIGDWTNNGLTFTLTTESANIITAANNFNVESSTSITIKNNCGGTKYRLLGYVPNKNSSDNPTNIYDSGLLSWDVSVGSTKTLTVTPNSTTIYNCNKTSKTGTVTWYLDTYISDTSSPFADRTKTCTYTFDGTKCGPSMSTFQYAVTDSGTQTIMGATSGYVNYNSGTNLNKFIQGKTTLNLKGTATASSKGSPTVSSYTVAVPGKSNTTYNETTFTDKSTGALSSVGNISVYCTDSRGFTSSSLSFAVALNSYYTPVINTFTAVRRTKTSASSTEDTSATLTLSATMPSYMNGRYKVHYKYAVSGQTLGNDTDITSSVTWNNGTITYSGNTPINIFNVNSEYNIVMYVKDMYYNVETPSVTVHLPVSAPLLAKRVRRLGINCIPGNDYALDVSGSIHTDSSLSVDGAASVGTNLVVKNTINNTFSAYCSSTNNYPYHLLAQSPVATASWYDGCIVLLVTQGYIGGNYGIVKIDMRTNNVSEANAGQGSAYWLVRKGWNVDAILIGLRSTSGNTYVDVFLRMPSAYGSTTITPLLVGNRAGFNASAFTLKNSNQDNRVNVYASITTSTTSPRTYTNVINAFDAGTVNYANSAGSASSATSATTATNLANRSFVGRSTIGDAGWTGSGTNPNDVICRSLIAYWNGCYSGTSSNLQYCDRGRFGTIVTKGTGDYTNSIHNACCTLKLTSRYTKSGTAWSVYDVEYSGRSTFTNSNSNYFEQSGNGVKCKFAGWIQVNVVIYTDIGTEFNSHIYKGSTDVIGCVNTTGKMSLSTSVVQVANGDIIYSKFTTGKTSSVIYENSNITIIRVS